MSSTPQECYEERMRKEFEQTYSDSELFTLYCIENEITLTPETPDAYDEDDYEEFKQNMYEEYKEMRE